MSICHCNINHHPGLSPCTLILFLGNMEGGRKGRRRWSGKEGGEEEVKEEKILSLTRNRRGPTSLTPPLLTQWHRTPRGTPATAGARDTWRVEGGSVLNWHPHPIRYIADSVQFCAFWPYLQIWYLIQSVLQTGRQKYSQWIPEETMLRPWIKNCWDYQIWMNPLSDTFQRRNYCMVWSLSTKSLLLIWHVAITIGMVALSRYRAAVLFARALSA